MSERTVKIEIVPTHTLGYYEANVFLNGVQTRLHFRGNRPQYEAFRSSVMEMPKGKLLALVTQELGDVSRRLQWTRDEVMACEYKKKLLEQAEAQVEAEPTP